MSKDFEHHGQAAVSATLFQSRPSKILDQSGGTTVVVSVACDIPGRVALDLFKFLCVSASVRIPDSGSILDSRPDVCFVGDVSSIFGAGPQIPRQKSTTAVGSLADGVDMVIEGQFRVNVHAKKAGGRRWKSKVGRI